MKSVKLRYHHARWSILWKNNQLPIIDLEDLAPEASYTHPKILEKLYLPPYAGPQDHDDTVPVFSLIKYIQPNLVVELGTGYGATAANICALTNAKVITVNALPEQIEGNLITFSLTREEIGYVYRKYGFSERIIQLFENTKNLDLSNVLPHKLVDLAIIDACHDPDFVVNDFFTVLPTLKEKSIVLIHDVHPSMFEHLDGGYIACMYLRSLGFNIQHIRNTWWGIWNGHGEPWAKVRLIQRVANIIDKLLFRTMGFSSEEKIRSLQIYSRWFLKS